MPAKKTPAILKQRKLRSARLQFVLTDEQSALMERARSSRTGRAAKTLVKDGPLRATIVAMCRGTEMKEHHVDGPASVQVLKGSLLLRTVGGEAEVGTGGLIVFDSGVAHDVTALRDSTFLITISYTGK